MRLMTMKELNRVFSLRESRRVKARVRKKNRELPLAKAKGFFQSITALIFYFIEYST